MAKMRISPELKKLIEKYRCVKDTEGMSPARGISEDKPPKHTTSPRIDTEISENYRKPAERNHSKEISTSPANALKIPSRIFCGPSFLLLCMETHDIMDLAAVKETGKSEVVSA